MAGNYVHKAGIVYLTDSLSSTWCVRCKTQPLDVMYLASMAYVVNTSVVETGRWSSVNVNTYRTYND